MKRTYLWLLAVVCCGLSSVVSADDIERFKGKWKGNTVFQGSEAEISLVFDGKVAKFEIGGFIFGKADVVLSEHNGFRFIEFKNMEAGDSESNLNPVDVVSKNIYVFGYRSFTLASNLDSSATEDPRLVVYKKVE